jgi:hypothetical protein
MLDELLSPLLLSNEFIILDNVSPIYNKCYSNKVLLICQNRSYIFLEFNTYFSFKTFNNVEMSKN